MYGKLAIYLPVIDFFDTLPMEFSRDRDLEEDIFFDDWQRGIDLSIDF
jgi:hypothetical protein